MPTPDQNLAEFEYADGGEAALSELSAMVEAQKDAQQATLRVASMGIAGLLGSSPIRARAMLLNRLDRFGNLLPTVWPY